MQNHARTGGILSIISGVFGILGLFVFILVAAVMMFMPSEINLQEYGLTEGLLAIVAVMYIVLGVIWYGWRRTYGCWRYGWWRYGWNDVPGAGSK